MSNWSPQPTYKAGNFDRALLLGSHFSSVWKTPGAPGAEWEHSILFAGIEAAEVKRMAKRLNSEFATKKAPLKDPHWVVDRVLSALAKEEFPEREFYSPAIGVHELRDRIENHHTEPAAIRMHVEEAFNSLIPLEFGYRSLRKNAAGELNEEIHSRRVNIRSIDPLGFNGRHSRGNRRFNFEKVAWATAERGLNPENVKDESLVILHYQSDEERTKFSTTVGYLGENGKLQKLTFKARS